MRFLLDNNRVPGVTRNTRKAAVQSVLQIDKSPLNRLGKDNTNGGQKSARNRSRKRSPGRSVIVEKVDLRRKKKATFLYPRTHISMEPCLNKNRPSNVSGKPSPCLCFVPAKVINWQTQTRDTLRIS